jgi:hypothetical protein
LAAIVHALGGDLWAGGRRANVPGPGHSRADRSVSLLLDGDRVVIHAFAGEDWRTVRRQLQDLGLVDALGRIRAGGGGCGVCPGPGGPPSDGLRVRTAAALWSEGCPLHGTPAERHLRLRQVRRPAGSALRFHPAVPAAIYAARGPRRPAMLAAVRDAAGEVVAVEVTYLRPDGRLAPARLPRKTVGVLPTDAAVRLDPAGERLLVGEGVATCLSASERFGWPAWALLSAGRMQRWRPPAGVRQVLVAADADAAGQRAANVLASELRAVGVVVAVRAPPAPFGDWNEAACGPGVKARKGAGRPEPLERPRDRPG